MIRATDSANLFHEGYWNTFFISKSNPHILACHKHVIARVPSQRIWSCRYADTPLHLAT